MEGFPKREKAIPEIPALIWPSEISDFISYYSSHDSPRFTHTNLLQSKSTHLRAFALTKRGSPPQQPPSSLPPFLQIFTSLFALSSSQAPCLKFQHVLLP